MRRPPAEPDTGFVQPHNQVKNNNAKGRRFAATITILGVVFAGIAALAAIPTGLVDLKQLFGSDTPSTSAPIDGLSNPSTRNMSAEPEPTTVAVLPCTLEGTPTSCQAEHTSEQVTGLTECSKSQLITFMGGRNDMDILREGLSIAEDGETCLVNGIDSKTRQSLEGILASPAGDLYRLCWDAATNNIVGCDVPHNAELIFQDSVESLDCKEQYIRYVGRPFDSGQDPSKIKLRSEAGTTSTCWVQTTPPNRLTGSIRDLQDKALPFSDN